MSKQTIIFFCFLLGTIVTKPENKRAQAHFQLAQVMKEQGDVQEAIKHYSQAIQCEPNHAGALFQLGCLLYQKGDFDGAIEALEQRNKQVPSCAKTELGLARAWRCKSNIDNAIQHYRRSVELNPQQETAQLELAALLDKQGNLEGAVQVCRYVIQLNPNHDHTRVYLADLLARLGRNKEALEYFNHLTLSHPGDPQLLMRKAHLLTLLGHPDEALTLYIQILEFMPNNSKILYNIAHVNRQLGNIEDALTFYQRSLELNPNNERALLGYAHTLIYAGKDQEGWQALDTINRLSYQGNVYLDSLEDLTQKKILIGGDWLHENIIQFVRYAENLKERGAHIGIQIPKALASMLKECPYIDDVIIMEKDRSYPHHYYIPITSLPHLFKAHENNIPKTPYLNANPQLMQKWHNTLQSDNRLRVGICIQSNEHNLWNNLMKLGQYNDLQLYILNSNTLLDLSKIPDQTVIQIICNSCKENNENFPHLAAIIKNLDLVITHDSTIAHLAGALHVPVWVLLKHIEDWRWQMKRKDCPWYPTMRLFRQEKLGVWDDIIQDIHKELEKLRGTKFQLTH